MKKIKISEEYIEKYENNEKFDDSLFDTDQEIEVRIPFIGYNSITIKCKDPQVAMATVLKADKEIGIMSYEGSEQEIEEYMDDNEIYAVMR